VSPSFLSPHHVPYSLLALAVLVAGCVRGESEQRPRRVPRVDALSLGSAGKAVDRKPHPPASTVTPGTPLGEAGFASALRKTGARLIVVPVFAAECGPCMTEALRLTARRPAWKAIGVDVMGMGMDETAADVRRFFHATGERVDYPLYHAPWFAKKNHVDITPTVFIYSADGKRLFRTDVTESEPDIQAVLEKKLAELVGEG